MGEIKLETVQSSILITLRRFWMSRERPARSFRFAISPQLNVLQILPVTTLRETFPSPVPWGWSQTFSWWTSLGYHPRDLLPNDLDAAAHSWHIFVACSSTARYAVPLFLLCGSPADKQQKSRGQEGPRACMACRESGAGSRGVQWWPPPGTAPLVPCRAGTAACCLVSLHKLCSRWCRNCMRSSHGLAQWLWKHLLIQGHNP